MMVYYDAKCRQPSSSIPRSDYSSESWNFSKFAEIGENATLGLQGSAQLVTPAPRIMAKKSWIARNARKKETVEKYAALRLKLKAEKDYVGLSMLPRDASPTRLVNRCEITGRRRAFLRRFRLSRITFRELASAGMLPGVTKSSW
jgi:small subunit ribosomal protein S14